jgi:energy-coupling factor transport system permease protein
VSVPAVRTVASRAPLARLNPITKLAVAAVLGVALLITVDAVTAGTILAVELIALPLTGLGARPLAQRLAPLLAVGTSVTIINAMTADPGGEVLLTIGPLGLTTDALVAGVSAGLRVCAPALPGVVLLSTTDPTDLADALAQRLHLPHRFILGALAAVRLLTVLAEEWRSLARARRARGMAAGSSPMATLRSFPDQVFALLVAAIRRATRMATAMEARGLGVRPQRTWARPSPFAALDTMVAAATVVLAGGATALAVTLGTWRPPFG